jgi:hypothetical protein
MGHLRVGRHWPIGVVFASMIIVLSVLALALWQDSATMPPLEVRSESDEEYTDYTITLPVELLTPEAPLFEGPHTPTVSTAIGNDEGRSWSWRIDHQGDHLFVADEYRGLRIIDVSEPTHPIEVAHTGGGAFGVAIRDSIVYVTTDVGLEIYDVSNPNLPIALGAIDHLGPDNNVILCSDLVVVDDIAWAACNPYGVYGVDISDPMQPQEIAYIDGPAWTSSVDAFDHHIVIADMTKLWIFDVSSPSQPTHVSEVDFEAAVCMNILADRAYSVNTWGDVASIDISDPQAPVIVNNVRDETISRSLFDTASDGCFASNALFFIASTQPGDAMRIIDVSDPTQPTERGILAEPGYALGVVVSGDYAYVTFGDGIGVVDITDPDHPVIVGTLSDSG